MDTVQNITQPTHQNPYLNNSQAIFDTEKVQSQEKVIMSF